MGYLYQNNGNIKDYWPDDTEDTIYVEFQRPMSEIIEIINEKFGTNDLSKVTIESQYIHTSFLTYDGYDPMDHTCFIVIKHNK